MEKELIPFLTFALVLVSFIYVCCATTGSELEGDSLRLISGNQRAAGGVEVAVEGLERAVEDGRERIRAIVATSERIEGAAERLEYLFAKYEQEVSRILDELDDLRRQVEAAEADACGVVDSAFSDGGG